MRPATVRSLAKWRACLSQRMHNIRGFDLGFRQDVLNCHRNPCRQNVDELASRAKAEISGRHDSPLGPLEPAVAAICGRELIQARWPRPAWECSRSAPILVRTDAGTNLCSLGERSRRATVSNALKVVMPAHRHPLARAHAQARDRYECDGIVTPSPSRRKGAIELWSGKARLRVQLATTAPPTLTLG